MNLHSTLRTSMAAAVMCMIATSASADVYVFSGNVGSTAFNGTFSFDVPAGPDDEALLTSFSFTFGGQNYTLNDAVSAPSVWFFSGQPSWFQYGAQSNGATLELASLDFAQGMLTYTDANQAVTSGTFQISAVPEPESYALMLGGLGLVGWLARRRQAV